MSNFRIQYDPPTRFHMEPGVRVKTLYGPIFDDRGVMSLVETGKHNLYAEIQSHKDSVDINVLIARYRSGDPDALSRIQGAYGDFTQMPKTYAEALNAMIGAEQYFASLPPEVRAKFNHDFNQFLASMDSPTFASDMGIAPPAPPVGSESSSAPSQPSTPTSPPASSEAG